MTLPLVRDAVVDRLWHDDSVLRFKLTKTQSTIQSLKRMLESRSDRTDEQREFSRLLSWCESTDRKHCEKVFADPRAHHWAITAYDLFAAAYHGVRLPGSCQDYLNSIGADHPEQAFACHLRQFGLFAVSVAHYSRASLSINAVTVGTPNVLPATRWSISNESGLVEIGGINQGTRLQLLIDGRPFGVSLPDRTTRFPTGLTIHCAPQVTCDSGVVSLQPHEFNVSGVRELRPVIAASPESQNGLIGEIESSLANILSYDPKSYYQIANHMKVVAFKPRDFGGRMHASSPLLPGATVVTDGRHPLVLADELLYEFYRNRISALREDGGIFRVTPGATLLRTYYSPWSESPCPINELFFCRYALERVLNFWVAAIESNDLSGLELEYAAFRSTQLAHQLLLASAQLDTWASFTPLGSEYNEAIKNFLRRHIARIDALGISGDAELIGMGNEGQFFRRDGNQSSASDTAEQLLRRHVEHFDVHGRLSAIIQNPPNSCFDYTKLISNLVPDVPAKPPQKIALSA